MLRPVKPKPDLRSQRTSQLLKIQRRRGRERERERWRLHQMPQTEPPPTPPQDGKQQHYTGLGRTHQGFHILRCHASDAGAID
eukprot:2232794-Rhodomonas_salina.1